MSDLKYADGWFMKAFNRIVLTICNTEAEICSNPYHKSQLIAGMKYSAPDYTRGVYNVQGFGTPPILTRVTGL